ncbi:MULTISPECIES: MarR family winged helix-turn-helix transcriptional regulator [Pseudothermotoga]|jgi:DNA-binding MarR family transcriptional regulator|uniref:Transcriptional regulator, MarR family n=1 Tax=Pseudothermotoga lettingae (strain ATCC BAA-301 / DSM 14385 / NBRC 107922 / TMO) TaxID=416591 RepID=A8F3Z9_PSELT|nr:MULTISPECIES: MarR family transcriptional regulator [Pseudothermotoga]ABV32883.1 transcriptional regulator, MarR family [Pseudothermotoga lettingae TMO]GLI48119.1 MarR family transcriptional regulator [Pseudothermotoga lettingae TMO]HBJ81553.1 MarR family transcriptional regulator [Pseudothermotoga sp.]
MDLDSEKIMKSVFDLVLAFSKMLNFNSEVENLRAIELYVLLYVAQKGPQKMSELAEVFSMTKSNITFLVDNLEKNGFVERERSNEDRRVIYIRLTDRGRDIYRQILDDFAKLIDKVASQIPEQDLLIISDGFERLSRLFRTGGER